MLDRIEPIFVEFIPGKLASGKLYISMEYATASHLCCCGCGEKVVTPFSPTDWRMSTSIDFDGCENYDTNDAAPSDPMDPIGVGGGPKSSVCNCGMEIAAAALALNAKDPASWAETAGVHAAKNSPTCNILVGTAVENAGFYAPKRYGGLWGYVSATSWSNPKSDMSSNWEVDSSEHVGDVVADHGHVGIVVTLTYKDGVPVDG